METNAHVVARAQAAIPPVLSAQGIHKMLGGVEVLKGVSLDVASHEVIGIIGPSGGGKSTFLRCLNLLERPDRGDVLLNGESLLRCKPREVARHRARIAMVFQHFELFPHLTAMQNVTLGPVHALGVPRAEANERAKSLLARVGLEAKCEAYPRHLSGGQQQRVAIARALALEPLVVLFDEPTAALDAELVAEVLEVILDLAGTGMTMIVVSHEVGFVREAVSRVLFLDAGSVIEDGPPRDVFENPQHTRAKRFMEKLL